MFKRSLLKCITILFFTVFIHNVAFSCICAVNVSTPFCHHVTATNNNVLLVKVLQRPVNTYYMEVEVIESISSNISEDTILVAGSNGIDCNAQLVNFNNGDSLIVALTPNIVSSWYPLFACGIHSLVYENGLVKGAISDSISVMPYSDFKQNIFSCFNSTLDSEDLNQALTFELYPNPTKAVLNVESEYSIRGYEVFNSTGQLLAIESLENELEVLKINTDHFQAGIHYIMLRTSKGIITRKFLKVF